MRQICCVLWDMDGSFVQTESKKARAHVQVVASFGGKAPRAAYKAVMGRSFQEVAAHFLSVAGIQNVDLAIYRRRYEQAYDREICAGVQLCPGAAELALEIHESGIRQALVTSSGRTRMLIVLEHVYRLLGRRDIFACTICAEDVSQHKPHPEPYQKTMEYLRCTSANCVVIEDSEAGIMSARAALARIVVALRHRYNVRQDFSAATRVVKTLRRVSIDWLRRLP